MRIALMVLALMVAPVHASPEGERAPDVLKIDGMEPITAADLTRFTGLAVRLAAASASDPRVEPMLEETLVQVDRGVVKRAVAFLALCAMKREQTARQMVGHDMRDRAVMKIVRACLADQMALTHLPER